MSDHCWELQLSRHFLGIYTELYADEECFGSIYLDIGVGMASNGGKDSLKIE